MGYSSVDRGSGLEVKLGKSDRRGMVAITMGYSGMGRGSDIEVRLGNSDRRGMVAIFAYFWVHFLSSWVCSGMVWWFVAACSWVSGMVCSGEISL